MKIEELIDELQTIPDWRRGKQPVEYPLWSLLLVSLLAVMSGYSSLRGISDFMTRHYQEVMGLLGYEVHSAPSYPTVRRMSHRVSPEQVSHCFHRWTQADEQLQSAGAIAIDGKALGSTVTDYSTTGQDFVMVVSAAVHGSGWVAAQTTFQNAQSSEIDSVRTLLQQLEVQGVWLTLDALHCQKNGR